jgi:1-acyl-sn-glycerol-3-phosphate acyltransferase
VVFISNHASFVDIWALLAVLPGSPRFVAKKEFMYFPIMGQAMRAMGHIAIDRARRSSAFASYDRAADSIRRGVSAVVFAEGTRSRTGKLQPFKKGPFVLAIAAQVPIVPVFCAGTFARMPKGSITPTPGIVELRFGPPIVTEGMVHDDRDELSRRGREALLRLGAVEA